jgi:hypothetical protein
LVLSVLIQRRCVLMVFMTRLMSGLGTNVPMRRDAGIRVGTGCVQDIPLMMIVLSVFVRESEP